MAMINPKTISESFIAWLESQDIATFGTDLYLNQVPEDAPNACYWVITSGGSTIMKLQSGEKVKQYFTSVYYRSVNGEDIEKNMFDLEELLNKRGCFQLTGFETIEVEANQYPSDTDLDNEDRRIGMLQANIKIYKKEQ